MDSIFEELLLYCFRFLELSDLLRAEGVCKRWWRVAKDAHLWKNMCDYSFMGRAMRGDDAGKALFVKTYRQAQNMWLGNCSVVTLQKSTASILGVGREKNLLVSATYHHVNVWNLENMTCVSSIEDAYEGGGNGSKRAVLVKRGKVVFSSSNHTATVYNLVSKRKAGVLVGHTNKISTVNWDSPSYLCTGSRDGTVRFWDTRTFTCSSIIDVQERVRTAKPLPSNSSVITVASGNGRVSYFDIRNTSQPFEQLTVFGGVESVTGMKIIANAVLYSVNHTYLYKYDLDTRITKAFIDGTTSLDPMKIMASNESTVVVGYNHGIIRAWNNETLEYLYHLKVGREYANVVTMMFDESTLVFGLDNGVIGACDFDKGTMKQRHSNPATLPMSGRAFSSVPFTRHFSSIPVNAI